MTPQELKDRRRDRELRKQWLRQKREVEIARLVESIEGIRSLKAEYLYLSDVFDLAIDAANLALGAMQRENGTAPEPAPMPAPRNPGRKMQRSKQ